MQFDKASKGFVLDGYDRAMLDTNTEFIPADQAPDLLMKLGQLISRGQNEFELNKDKIGLVANIARFVARDNIEYAESTIDLVSDLGVFPEVEHDTLPKDWLE